MKSGPIIIIDDDSEDREVIEEALRDIGVKNKITWFNDCNQSFEYLKATAEQPFIILCDINLPKQSGIAFKRQIDGDSQLRQKSIPFIFYSTYIDQELVNEAYINLTVQGFFKKLENYQEIKKQMRTIIDYWLSCRHPNTI